MKTILRYLVFILLVVVVCLGLGVTMISGHVMTSQNKNIAAKIEGTKDTLTSGEIKKLKKQKADCILVLGAGIMNPETPSPMLKDRLDTAYQLYEAGVAPKLLLSGDNGTVTHNEIHVMLRYMEKKGVPEEDIFCDHAGFSTYDSCARAKSIFQVKRAVIVTQSYHLYRALYTANRMGIKSVGAAADQQRYSGQFVRDVREILARVKDWGKVGRGDPASVGGEKIPITGSGVSSHGE